VRRYTAENSVEKMHELLALPTILQLLILGLDMWNVASPLRIIIKVLTLTVSLRSTESKEMRNFKQMSALSSAHGFHSNDPKTGSARPVRALPPRYPVEQRYIPCSTLPIANAPCEIRRKRLMHYFLTKQKS